MRKVAKYNDQESNVDLNDGTTNVALIRSDLKITRIVRNTYSSGQQKIDPTLQDEFAPHVFHVVSSHGLHSIIASDLSTNGKEGEQRRQTVFFTAVNPMEEENAQSTAMFGNRSQDKRTWMKISTCRD